MAVAPAACAHCTHSCLCVTSTHSPPIQSTMGTRTTGATEMSETQQCILGTHSPAGGMDEELSVKINVLRPWLRQMSTQGLGAAAPFWDQNPPSPDWLGGKPAHFLTLGVTPIPSCTKLPLCQGFGHGIHSSGMRPDFVGRPCCRGVIPKTIGLLSLDLDRNPKLANGLPCLIVSCP